MKADRLPRRVVKRLTDAQHRALDELRFTSPSATRRGELKTLLGWKRTREETIAYARSLLDQGVILTGITARLDVDRRYLAGLLKKEPPALEVPGKACVQAGESATNVQTPNGESSRGCLPAPASGFRSLKELDAWLEGVAS